MAGDKKTQAEVAADLARFLTTKASGYGYDRGQSPLELMLAQMITEMTRQVAREVIGATPELASHVRRMVERTVENALRDDAWLNQTVVEAVSKAITGLALERVRDDD